MSESAETKASFGCVLWMKSSEEWFCLTQVSYSVCKLDIKADPLRGRAQRGESCAACAARELCEESCGAITLRADDLAGVHMKSNLFHVAVDFDGSGPGELLTCFDENLKASFARPEREEECTEADGLCFLARSLLGPRTCAKMVRGGPRPIRIAKEIRDMAPWVWSEGFLPSLKHLRFGEKTAVGETGRSTFVLTAAGDSDEMREADVADSARQRFWLTPFMELLSTDDQLELELFRLSELIMRYPDTRLTTRMEAMLRPRRDGGLRRMERFCAPVEL